MEINESEGKFDKDINYEPSLNENNNILSTKFNKNNITEEDILKPDKLIMKRKKGVLREFLGVIIFLITASVLIRIFLIEAYTIPSGSMIPTFQYQPEGDRLIATKFLYGVRIPVLNISLPGIANPKKGDIIIFEHPEYQSPGWEWEFLNLLTLGILRIDNNEFNIKILVKRCMAEPGDTLIIDSNKDIYINGEKLEKELLTDYEQGDNSVIYVDNSITHYKESNEDKSYIIQEYSNTVNPDSSPTYYIPKKGDELIVKRITTKYGGKRYEYFINGKELEEEVSDKYKPVLFYELGLNPSELSENEYEVKFKHNYYFAMGDNRDNSRDSRAWGLVRDELIFGSPLFIFYPFDRIKLLK